MTIKFGNFATFIVRNFVVIWEAPTFSFEMFCQAGGGVGFKILGLEAPVSGGWLGPHCIRVGEPLWRGALLTL